MVSASRRSVVTCLVAMSLAFNVIGGGFSDVSHAHDHGGQHHNDQHHNDHDDDHHAKHVALPSPNLHLSDDDRQNGDSDRHELLHDHQSVVVLALFIETVWQMPSSASRLNAFSLPYVPRAMQNPFERPPKLV